MFTYYYGILCRITKYTSKDTTNVITLVVSYDTSLKLLEVSYETTNVIILDVSFNTSLKSLEVSYDITRDT